MTDLDLLQTLINEAVKNGLFQNSASVVLVQDAFNRIKEKLIVPLVENGNTEK